LFKEFQKFSIPTSEFGKFLPVGIVLVASIVGIALGGDDAPAVPFLDPPNHFCRKLAGFTEDENRQTRIKIVKCAFIF